MYSGIKSSISVNGENSPFFACDCGVRQGENLSPVMFSLYLNDLESFLMHKGLSGITVGVNNEEPGRVAQSVGHLIRGPGFDTRSGNILSFLLPLFQEGQLSVTGESMCTKYWLTA